MIKSFIIVAVIFAALLSSMTLSGCGSTWDGFGQDVEDVGEDIQD